MTERNGSPWGPPPEVEGELRLEDATCDACGKQAERHTLLRVQGQLRCAECASKPQAVGSQPIGRPIGSQPLGPPLRSPASLSARPYVVPAEPRGSLIGAFIGGLVGASIGGAVWAGVAIGAHIEVGLVGILVGIFAAVGVKSGAGIGGVPLQRLLAVVMALAGLVAAKYAIFSYFAVKVAHEKGVELGYLGKFVMSKFSEVVTHLTPYQIGLEIGSSLLAILAAFFMSRRTSA